ncbi:unnamed protein product [Trichobilharzia regenti]|nr:unnamed protein product [Trichobilharzia regenti]
MYSTNNNTTNNNVICPTESFVEENTLPCMMITKTLNGNSVNAIKMQRRGRKAAPPPPPKSTTTLEKSTKRSTIDGYHTGSQPADAKEDMKTSEKVTSSQGSKKKPPCKVSIESRKLGESLKGHRVDVLESFKIINRQSTSSLLRFAEAIAIKRLKPDFCVQKESVVGLQLLW